MKNKTAKRMAGMLLATSMSISALAGCGNSQSTAVVSKAETTNSKVESEQGQKEPNVQAVFEHDSNLSEPGVEPICAEPIELTIGVIQNTNVEDYVDNWFTQMLEEQANVKLDFYYFPASEYKSKLELMCAAGGDELPDIVMMDLSDSVVSKYGQDGMFIPLEDYYANSSYYYKNGFERVLEESGVDLMSILTAPDGHIYNVPQYNETVTNPCYARIWMYEPWLKAVGMDVPKTTDEFRAVLEAFKTQDPNGNGQADEIPALGSDIMPAATHGSWFWEAMMNAFVPTTSRVNYLNSNDHVLSVPYVTDEWKEGIKYIRGLCEDGLFDPISFTQDEATFKAMLNTEGDQLVGCFCFMSTSSIANSHPSKEGWILIEPLTGPEGVCATAYRPDVPVPYGYITKNCENPEAAFRLLDLLGKEEFAITSRWGKQGENWDYVEDLKDKEEYKNWDFSQTFAGYPALFLEYKTVWNVPNKNMWQNKTPSFRLADVAAGSVASSLIPGTANYELAYKLSFYEAVKTDEPITKFAYTSEEEVEATELAASLNSYVKEKIALWCTGAADVDKEWEGYLKELENIGLSRYLSITQTAYDR